MEMPPLTTERLLIRPFEHADLDAVAAILESDPNDAATERYVRHGGLNAAVLAKLGQPPLGDRAVVLRETDELIGLAGLVPAFGPFDQLRPVEEEPKQRPRSAPNRIEVGLYYNVAAAQRKRGIATEAARALVDFAFEHLHLGRIVATTERDNSPSQAVMHHLGMRMHENALPEPAWLQVVGILENRLR
jgi:RimJ/RimL family protein N-acetyltransferase